MSKQKRLERKKKNLTRLCIVTIFVQSRIQNLIMQIRNILILLFYRVIRDCSVDLGVIDEAHFAAYPNLNSV